MNASRLQSADAAYAAGDWTTAAREYLAAAAGETQGGGYALHRAGNALMKLRRFEDAVTVYERAVADSGYSDAPAVACNLGTAEMSLGHFEQAAKAFERALDDDSYGSRYKAFAGLGGARFELKQLDDAAEAYRRAALESDNPDPGKALNNLGLCFAMLNKPEDAVEAYRAAVAIPGYKGAGRTAANLGMAYAALGMNEKAAESFELAAGEFGFELNDSMEATYRASKSAAALDAAGSRNGATGTQEFVPVSQAPKAEVMFDEEEFDGDSRFFTITDAEMRVADRDTRRQERRDRNDASPAWIRVLMWLAIVVVITGVIVGAYLAGIGYPTQLMTVRGVLEAYADGDTVASYWVAVPPTDVQKAMASLPPKWASYKIGSVQRSARTSTVEVTVTLERGGVVTYQISLAREGVGWKVNGISTSFNSTSGGI